MLALLFRRLSPTVEARPASPGLHSAPAARLGLHRSGGVVLRLAGLFAMDSFAGGFVLQSILAYWFYVRFGTDEAMLRFRRQPSRIALVPIDGVEHAVVIDVGLRDDPGVLYLVRVRDGAVVSRTPLDGNGQRYAMPLVDGARVWVSSCEAPGEGAGHFEAFDLRRE